MKAVNAVIGGEGNGGVINPASHYGRDALVGIALFLTHLAKSKKTVSALKKEYPQYYISKNKIELTPSIDVDKILATIKNNYQRQYEVNDIDGVKIDFPTGWVHLRKSNTEAIIRIYAEANTKEQAETFAKAVMDEIRRVATA
jgi:phosphomannomutase